MLLKKNRLDGAHRCGVTKSDIKAIWLCNHHSVEHLDGFELVYYFKVFLRAVGSANKILLSFVCDLVRSWTELIIC